MNYFVNDNAQANGDHEVHTAVCAHGPSVSNRTLLGDFTSCMPAVTAAKKLYARANGCYYCATTCHTG